MKQKKFMTFSCIVFSADLFDSGKSEYNASGREFGNLAYAKADSNNLGRFIYTEIGDIEK